MTERYESQPHIIDIESKPRVCAKCGESWPCLSFLALIGSVGPQETTNGNRTG